MSGGKKTRPGAPPAPGLPKPTRYRGVRRRAGAPGWPAPAPELQSRHHLPGGPAMCPRAFAGLALLGLLSVAPTAPAAAEDTRKDEPTLLVQVKPIDVFFDLARYVIDVNDRVQKATGAPGPSAADLNR